MYFFNVPVIKFNKIKEFLFNAANYFLIIKYLMFLYYRRIHISFMLLYISILNIQLM